MQFKARNILPIKPCVLIDGGSLNVNTDCKQIQADRFVFDNLQFNPKITSQHLALFPLTSGILTSASAAGLSAAIYLQFHAQKEEWRYLGAIGEGKESVFFKVQIPEGLSNVNGLEVLPASLGISIVPTVNLPLNHDQNQTTKSQSLVVASNNHNPIPPFNPTDSLMVAKKLLDNFVNYALSYSQTFLETGTEAFIPAKIITDWYNNTVRKAQLDPVAFFSRLTKSD